LTTKLDADNFTNPAQIEQAYSYSEEPNDDDDSSSSEEPEEQQEQQEEEPSSVKRSKRRSSALDPWTEAMNAMSLANIKKLAIVDTYTIAGETYKRKLLTPKVRIQLDRLQNEMIVEKDEEKKMDITKQQALLCLDGMTSEKFDNTDIGHLEQVIGACIMAAKGFRKI
jgi:hypothetical protein